MNISVIKKVNKDAYMIAALDSEYFHLQGELTGEQLIQLQYEVTKALDKRECEQLCM